MVATRFLEEMLEYLSIPEEMLTGHEICLLLQSASNDHLNQCLHRVLEVMAEQCTVKWHAVYQQGNELLLWYEEGHEAVSQYILAEIMTHADINCTLLRPRDDAGHIRHVVQRLSIAASMMPHATEGSSVCHYKEVSVLH